MDVLTNYTVATPGAFTAGTPEETLEGNPAGVAMATLGVAVVVGRARPALVDRLYDAVSLLLNAGGTNAEIARITAAMGQLASMQTQNAAKLTQAIAPTAARHLQQTYPWATLFQACVKNVEKGMDIKPEAGEMFDAVSGKRYVPFPGSMKVSSGAKLMHSLDVFCDALISLKNLAPSVWREFKRRVVQTESTDGFIFAQEFVDATLRKLDEKAYTDIHALMRAGEHNRILDEIKHNVKPSFDPKGRKPWDKDPRPRIQFGKVDVPVGGKGAGIINDFATKQPKMCNRFHGKPQTACTAGVPDNGNYPKDQVGLCAYAH